MDKTKICNHCKKLIDSHTVEESNNCKIEIAKKRQPKLKDEDIIDYFNETKISEPARMSGRQKPNNWKETDN